jgi:hypothetical protein
MSKRRNVVQVMFYIKECSIHYLFILKTVLYEARDDNLYNHSLSVISLICSFSESNSFLPIIMDRGKKLALLGRDNYIKKTTERKFRYVLLTMRGLLFIR